MKRPLKIALYILLGIIILIVVWVIISLLAYKGEMKKNQEIFTRNSQNFTCSQYTGFYPRFADMVSHPEDIVKDEEASKIQETGLIFHFTNLILLEMYYPAKQMKDISQPEIAAAIINLKSFCTINPDFALGKIMFAENPATLSITPAFLSYLKAIPATADETAMSMAQEIMKTTSQLTQPVQVPR